MYLVAIAWMYVVVMMAVVEAMSANGTVIGAIVTFVLYGLLPLSIVLYILRSPQRRKARLAADRTDIGDAATASTPTPDDGNHAAGDAVAPKREEA
jgi:hypothetical protein